MGDYKREEPRMGDDLFGVWLLQAIPLIFFQPIKLLKAAIFQFRLLICISLDVNGRKKSCVPIVSQYQFDLRYNNRSEMVSAINV